MKLYIAHNFDARLHLRTYVIPKFFEGHEIVSSWITDESVLYRKEEENALIDIEDLEKADCVVINVDPFSNCTGRGKWWEFGYAYAKGKLILLVGDNKECVFNHIPGIVQVSSWIHATMYLKLKAKAMEQADGLS